MVANKQIGELLDPPRLYPIWDLTQIMVSLAQLRSERLAQRNLL